MSDLGERLRARGKRLTSQRERVLAAVGRLGHATPDEIVEAVAADGGGAVPASTVYRALEALQELGLVGHTHVDHRAPSYHLAEHATHLHVVCRGCGWVGEAPLSSADELVARLDESLGLRLRHLPRRRARAVPHLPGRASHPGCRPPPRDRKATR